MQIHISRNIFSLLNNFLFLEILAKKKFLNAFLRQQLGLSQVHLSNFTASIEVNFKFKPSGTMSAEHKGETNLSRSFLPKF